MFRPHAYQSTAEAKSNNSITKKSFDPDNIRENWSHMMAEHSPFASLDKRSFPNRFLLENALGKFSKRSNNDNDALENVDLGPKYMDNFLSLFLYQHM